MSPIIVHSIRVGIVLTAAGIGYCVGRKVTQADSKKKLGKVTVIKTAQKKTAQKKTANRKK